MIIDYLRYDYIGFQSSAIWLLQFTVIRVSVVYCMVISEFWYLGHSYISFRLSVVWLPQFPVICGIIKYGYRVFRLFSVWLYLISAI